MATVHFINDSGETIPAFAIIQISEATKLGNKRLQASAQKPDGSDGATHIVNGPVPVEDGKTGHGTIDHFVWVKYTGGPPAAGDEWGPDDDWGIESGGGGFLVLNVNTTAGRAFCRVLNVGRGANGNGTLPPVPGGCGCGNCISRLVASEKPGVLDVAPDELDLYVPLDLGESGFGEESPYRVTWDADAEAYLSEPFALTCEADEYGSTVEQFRLRLTPCSETLCGVTRQYGKVTLEFVGDEYGGGTQDCGFAFVAIGPWEPLCRSSLDVIRSEVRCLQFTTPCEACVVPVDSSLGDPASFTNTESSTGQLCAEYNSTPCFSQAWRDAVDAEQTLDAYAVNWWLDTSGAEFHDDLTDVSDGLQKNALRGNGPSCVTGCTSFSGGGLTPGSGINPSSTVVSARWKVGSPGGPFGGGYYYAAGSQTFTIQSASAPHTVAVSLGWLNVDAIGNEYGSVSATYAGTWNGEDSITLTKTSEAWHNADGIEQPGPFPLMPWTLPETITAIPGHRIEQYVGGKDPADLDGDGVPEIHRCDGGGGPDPPEECIGMCNYIFQDESPPGSFNYNLDSNDCEANCFCTNSIQVNEYQGANYSIPCTHV